MWRFLDGIAIPGGDLDDQVHAAVRDALAAQARLDGEARRFLELVFLVLRGFVAGCHALTNLRMTGGTGADAPARMFDFDVVTERDIQNAAGKAGSAVRNPLRIHVDPDLLSG